jgi:hypothetical protein
MVLVRRPGLLVSADNAMRCDAMLATSRSCNNARHSADGPATVYDVRASSVVHSLDRRARLVLAFRSQRVRRKTHQPNGCCSRSPWGPARDDKAHSPGFAQAVPEDSLRQITLDDVCVI